MARILICDDAAFMRMSLNKILTSGGHEVVGEAGNGKEGVKKYKELSPDVVLMDITMPELDGLEATKLIVESDPNAKVIMVSAMGQQDKVFGAFEAGADGIGLFRSEFLFMEKTDMTEESQFEAYKQALEAAKGKTVVIRTLDCGGDKIIKSQGENIAEETT